MRDSNLRTPASHSALTTRSSGSEKLLEKLKNFWKNFSDRSGVSEQKLRKAMSHAFFGSCHFLIRPKL